MVAASLLGAAPLCSQARVIPAPGDLVSLRQGRGPGVRGFFERQAGDTIYWRLDRRGPVVSRWMPPRSRLYRYEGKKPATERGALIGGGVGAGLGFILGGIAGSIDTGFGNQKNQSVGASVRGAALFGGAGLVIGSIVGSLSRREVWRRAWGSGPQATLGTVPSGVWLGFRQRL